MAKIKLQYSMICERDSNYLLKRIIHGFIPGRVSEFYISNNWVWEEGNEKEDGFYQVTELCQGTRIMAKSESALFYVKYSHTHHNRFRDLIFTEDEDYWIKIMLFDHRGLIVEKASLEYPLFVRSANKSIFST
jgi:nucleoside-specific outer membrane channel protein Tsx